MVMVVVRTYYETKLDSNWHDDHHRDNDDQNLDTGHGGERGR